MVIVNTQDSWETLSKRLQKEPFVYLQMFSDVNKHPLDNRVSCYYIRTMTREFIVPVHHNEKFSEDIQYLNIDTPMLVSDLKSHKHISMITSNEVYDLNWCHYMKTNQP